MSHNEQNFARRLRAMGYRLTPQRQLILDTLCQMEGHATISQIYEQVNAQAPAVDKSTIYRSLQLFEEVEFVLSATINGRTVYEIAAPHPHHHLVCQNCQRVIPLANHHFNDLADHLLAEHGFVAKLNHLAIPGICANCREDDS